jgi:membrane associated rhomboid family serine protease
MLIHGGEGHYGGRFPWVTASLVVINIVAYVAQVFLGEAFTNGFSLVPEKITTLSDFKGTKYHKVKLQGPGQIDQQGQYHPKFETKSFPIKHHTGPYPVFLTLLTSLFLHGGVGHLIVNMWFLIVFGRSVEGALNSRLFLTIYLSCGVFAGMVHVLIDAHSIVPYLGASGAIAGVLGTYFSIHPLNNVKVLFGQRAAAIEVPALILIGAWFVLQYISAFVTLDGEKFYDGVAYWTHLAGFCAGFAILRGNVFYLQWQQPEETLSVKEPIVATKAAQHEFMDALPEPVAPSLLDQPVASIGEPDPFASFLSVQTVRKMQKQK